MPEFFTSTIRDLSHKGLGVVDHPDGRTFFVRGTWPGDQGEFQIPEGARKYEEAQLVKLVAPSKDRVQIPCPHRGYNPGQCGGCPWMGAKYSAQLEFKVKRLTHALLKRGLTVTSELRAIVPSPAQLKYRNRVQLKTNGEALGYVSEGTSEFAPVEDCLIMNDQVHALFHELKTTLPREDFRPTGIHKWSFLDLDDEMTTFDVELNRRRPFRQGNTAQNNYMREWIREQFSKLPRHYPVIDLFCGSGNFTEVLVELGFTNILAVEVQGKALDILRAKNLNGVRILDLDMNSKGSWAQVARYQPHAKAILLDPPREGLEKRKGLFKYLDNLESIFYISCELDTFSRDVGDLIKNEWVLESLTPVDLFPHTPHVEILSCFQRPKSSTNL